MVSDLQVQVVTQVPVLHRQSTESTSASAPGAGVFPCTRSTFDTGRQAYRMVFVDGELHSGIAIAQSAVVVCFRDAEWIS